MRRAREYGFTGLIISKDYGGQDLGAFEWTIAVDDEAGTARIATAIAASLKPGEIVTLSGAYSTVRRIVSRQVSQVSPTIPEIKSMFTLGNFSD